LRVYTVGLSDEVGTPVLACAPTIRTLIRACGGLVLILLLLTSAHAGLVTREGSSASLSAEGTSDGSNASREAHHRGLIAAVAGDFDHGFPTHAHRRGIHGAGWSLESDRLTDHEEHLHHAFFQRLEDRVVAESLTSAESGPAFSLQELRSAGLARFPQWELFLAGGTHVWLTAHNPPVTLPVHEALAEVLESPTAAANPLIEYMIWRRGLDPERFDHYHPCLGRKLRHLPHPVPSVPMPPAPPRLQLLEGPPSGDTGSPPPSGGSDSPPPSGGVPVPQGGGPHGGGAHPNGPPASATPEPSTLTLAAVALTSALVYVRTRT
jgi:hypothetical protein